MIIGKAFRFRPNFKVENKNLDIPMVGMSKIEKEKKCYATSKFLRYMD